MVYKYGVWEIETYWFHVSIVRWSMHIIFFKSWTEYLVNRAGILKMTSSRDECREHYRSCYG